MNETSTALDLVLKVLVLVAAVAYIERRLTRMEVILSALWFRVTGEKRIPSAADIFRPAND